VRPHWLSAASPALWSVLSACDVNFMPAAARSLARSHRVTDKRGATSLFNLTPLDEMQLTKRVCSPFKGNLSDGEVAQLRNFCRPSGDLHSINGSPLAGFAQMWC
jgi:hypothetical protein